MAASLPPVITASHVPAAMRRAALAMAWVLAAQAVTVASHGPRHPNRIETVAAPAFDIIIGTRNGRDPLAALLVAQDDLVLEGVQAAHAGAEHHTGAVEVDRQRPGVVEGHGGGRHRQLREAVGAADLLRAEPLRGVEARRSGARRQPGWRAGRPRTRRCRSRTGRRRRGR
jgi:hypothetical protein